MYLYIVYYMTYMYYIVILQVNKDKTSNKTESWKTDMNRFFREEETLTTWVNAIKYSKRS